MPPVLKVDLEQIINTSLTYTVLIISLIVMFAVILWVKSLYRGDDDTDGFDHEMLTQIGELHRQGNLSEEEYRSIKDQLIHKADTASTPSTPAEEAEPELEGVDDKPETEA